MANRNLERVNFNGHPLSEILGAPKHTGNEPPFLLNLDDPLRFVELTAYPQRSALEPLLTID